MTRHIGPALCIIVLSLVSGAAMAISECAVTIVEVWSGAGGEILIVFDNSPPVYVNAPTSATDSAQKSAMATALTSLAAGKPVTIRYTNDGVACTAGQPSRTDFAGIWIRAYWGHEFGSEPRGKYMKRNGTNPKPVLRLIAMCTVFALSTASLAGGTVTNTTITQLSLNRGLGNFVFIQTSVAPTGFPSCTTGGGPWNFTLELNDSIGTNLYAMLLSAYFAGKQVRLDGTGLCSEWGGVESLSNIDIIPQ
jgi:hypothetical protein